MSAPDAHTFAVLLAGLFEDARREQEAAGQFYDWDWHWPDSDGRPESFGVVDERGELRFEIQVISW